MKDIFKATKSDKDRSTVIVKSVTRGMEVSGSSFPAIVEESLDGKTIIIPVVKGKVQGVFNRLGQAYPLKDKESKSSTATLGRLIKGFTPKGDGVYICQLVGEGINRTKVKQIISMTRATKLSGPEQTLVDEKLRLVFTDFFTLDEFNGELKDALSLEKRKVILILNITSGIKLKKYPQFRIVEEMRCDSLEDFGTAMVKFGSVYVRPIPVSKKESKKDETPKEEKKKKPKSKKSKKKK